MQNDPFAPHLLERLPASLRKVVLLRTSRIGDFLCAVPALRALRARLPGAEIHLITLPLLSELARRLPYLDRVWHFPGFPGLADQLFEARTAVRFLRQLQDESFDLALQMQGTGIYSNPFMLLLGARWTAGFVRPGDPAGLLDAAFPYPHHLHEIRCVLALTDFLGAPATGDMLEFPLGEGERRRALNFLLRWPLPWIGLHPSARDPARCWPIQRYIQLAQRLLARSGGTLFLLGDTQARPAARQIAQQLPDRCLDLTGRVSLITLGALIANLSLLITNDSGPAHIAYALRTPTVTLFNSRAAILTNGPLLPCPCCPVCPSGPTVSADDPGGIQQITVAQVLAAVETVWQKVRLPGLERA